METYFNELSIQGMDSLSYQDIGRLGSLYKALKGHDIHTCRISSEDYRRLITMVKGIPGVRPELWNFLFGFLREPYESVEVEQKQDLFLDHQWTWNGRECFGLALSHIMDSMALSTGNEIWNHPMITICQDEGEAVIRNLYDAGTFECHLEWLSRIKPVELIKSALLPQGKRIHLRADHGSDVLMDFAHQIVNNEYVEAVVNSTRFKPGNRNFIHDIKPNGIIEIVLSWTDAGYGIAIQSTGRNRRETERIADILKEKYGRKS